ncbi:oxidoreductase [Streptomyces nitrosporeus]|uniref:nitric oxide dioxygenase n=1 Tax=Streptomyces nitrosporeus TaxID=28894 RepID=A0A5J6F6F9_9ACTN|nr:globin domain-containing protein [Streptomyces nitrosporeus]QEU71722.1 oxidoreductase [Streptomyces nitrosporeus]GGY94818.1 hypothetical protein GCM10010327_26880 [Streptomyces nitrosporeus]
MNTSSEDYHALLARHDAMRLRRRILAPEGSGTAPRRQAPVEQAYDGRADQQLISACLPFVSPVEDLVEDLYRYLFERHPYLRSLFPESMAFQQAHLVAVFHHLIGNLHRPDELTERFVQLGRDHRKLGVRPAHFAAFEAALLDALRLRAGVRWSAPLEEAWLRMLRLAVTAMVRGEEEAIAEPSSWEALVTSHEMRAPDLAVLRVRPQQDYAFRAGQYAAVESPLLEQAWRPYYLARAPHQDGELEFHVRARGAGSVSDALVHGTRPGHTVRLAAPRGALCLPSAPSDDLLVIASGTGWAPAKALLQQITAEPARAHRVRLLLLDAVAGGAGRTAPEPYDTEYLEAFRRGKPWLTVIPAAQDTRTAGVELRALNGVLPPRPGAAARQHVCLVLSPEAEDGAGAQTRAFAERLTAAGVPSAHIHHDTSLTAWTEPAATRTGPGLLSA